MKQPDPKTGDPTPAECPLLPLAPEPPIVLTATERDVMQWAALGKSAWEISRIQGHSEAAVNFHLCNIRRKFGVSTLRAALVLAIVQGGIFTR